MSELTPYQEPSAVDERPASVRFQSAVFEALGPAPDGQSTGTLRADVALNARSLESTDATTFARAARAGRGLLCILQPGRIPELSNHEKELFSFQEVDYGLDQLAVALRASQGGRHAARLTSKADAKLVEQLGQFKEDELVVAARFISSGLDFLEGLPTSQRNLLLQPSNLWEKEEFTATVLPALLKNGRFGADSTHATTGIVHVRETLINLLADAIDRKTKQLLREGKI